MTKAEQKRIEVEANKLQAYTRKVLNLTGHIAHRLPMDELKTAYYNDKIAEEFAAEIVSREPVGKALHPTKSQAVKSAAEHAQKIVDRVAKEIAEADGDVNAVAPYPSSVWAPDYKQKVAKYNLYHSLVSSDDTKGHYQSFGRNKPYYVVMNDERIARFISNAERDAAFQYDAFICKMTAKIGEVVDAEINGSHVWGHSFLTVTKADGSKEVWKTQQITNYSKNGLPFLQWPSRKMK